MTEKLTPETLGALINERPSTLWFFATDEELQAAALGKDEKCTDVDMGAVDMKSFLKYNNLPRHGDC